MEHGWLTTLRKDGSPRTSRVWFVVSGESTWIATSEPSWKVADIRRDPRVSWALEGVDGARTLRATLRPIDEHPDVLTLFRQNYSGWNAADPADYGPRILIELTRDRD